MNMKSIPYNYFGGNSRDQTGGVKTRRASLLVMVMVMNLYRRSMKFCARHARLSKDNDRLERQIVLHCGCIAFMMHID